MNDTVRKAINNCGLQFVPLHGFRSITGTGNSILFEGFKEGQYFRIQSIFEYGATDYELLEGDFSEEEQEELIIWINMQENHIDDKVYKNWLKENDSLTYV